MYEHVLVYYWSENKRCFPFCLRMTSWHLGIDCADFSFLGLLSKLSFPNFGIHCWCHSSVVPIDVRHSTQTLLIISYNWSLIPVCYWSSSCEDVLASRSYWSRMEFIICWSTYVNPRSSRSLWTTHWCPSGAGESLILGSQHDSRCTWDEMLTARASCTVSWYTSRTVVHLEMT